MSRRWLSPGGRVRSWPARSRGDRARAGGGVAGGRQRRRTARRAGLARLPQRRAKPTPAPAGANGCRSLPRQRRVTRLDARTATFWITAERLPQFQAVCGPRPASSPRSPPGRLCRARLVARGRRWSKILRGRLEGLGPVTAGWLAHRSGLSRPRSAPRSPRSKPKVSPCAGAFRRTAAADEWCERRLLARIHRYTVKRLRAEIEPVAARDFLRFLPSGSALPPTRAWKGRMPSMPSSAQLEGFEAPAGAWESEILPARLAGYEPTWLDDRCLAGHVAWTRLRAPHCAQATDASPQGDAARRRAGADHADHAARAPSRRALGLAVRQASAQGGCVHPATRRRSFAITFACMEPRSSRSWRTAPVCCARRSKRRWANW